ncbi:MAG TPA: prepilin peptidase [Thermoanaerobaculia bacterium]
MTALLAFYALATGAIIGSFLNVVIHRYPREESIVFPPSHCPDCNTNIRWYDNVPILSYLALGARCRNCRVPISPRYPLIELANALFYLAIFQRTGPSVIFLPLAAIVSMTIVLIYIDLEIQILPDVIDVPGVFVGALIAWIGADFAPGLVLAATLLDSILGALLGAGILAAIILAYWLIRRREGMGWGDVKMLAMIGAVVGWQAVPAVLLLASITGAIVAVPLALRSKERFQLAIPFGVFLGIATLAVLFFGHTLFEWWLRAFVPN